MKIKLVIMFRILTMSRYGLMPKAYAFLNLISNQRLTKICTWVTVYLTEMFLNILNNKRKKNV